MTPPRTKQAKDSLFGICGSKDISFGDTLLKFYAGVVENFSNFHFCVRVYLFGCVCVFVSPTYQLPPFLQLQSVYEKMGHRLKLHNCICRWWWHLPSPIPIGFRLIGNAAMKEVHDMSLLVRNLIKIEKLFIFIISNSFKKLLVQYPSFLKR